MDGKVESYELDVFDTYSFVILGSISAITSGLLFVAHLRWKELRKPPGDLILMISLAEFMLAMHYLLSGIRTSWISEHYPDDSLFCLINSYVAIGSANADVLYNMCFLVHMMISLRNAAKKEMCTPRYSYHVVTLSLTALVLLKGHFGRNPYGTCSSKITLNTLYYSTIAFSIVISMSIYVYCRTKNRLKVLGSRASELRRDFSNYQGSMVIVFIFTSLGIMTAFHGQYQGTLPHYDTKYDWFFYIPFQDLIFNLGKLGSTMKVSMPSLLFIIRMRDPLIQKYIVRMLMVFGCKREGRSRFNTAIDFITVDSFEDEASFEIDEVPTLNSDLYASLNRSRRGTNYGSLIIDKKSALKNELMTFDLEDNAWIHLLPTLVKNGLTRTFLAAVSYFHPIDLKASDTRIIESLVAQMDSFVTFKMKEADVIAQFGLLESISDCMVTFYHTGYFEQVMAAHKERVSFRQSLNPKNNEDAIKRSGKQDGGASGELFLKSFDGKLLLKTITLEEFKVFNKLISDYSEYSVINRNSMIAKIFCLYSLEIPGTEKTAYAIIMENLMPFDPVKPIRTYDLKGSTYSRQVIIQKPGQSFLDSFSSNNQGTMKDIDFTNVEGIINLENKPQRAKIFWSLQRDLNFFVDHNIIDYSLLVSVYSKSELEFNGIKYEADLNIFESLDYPDHLYIIGIIDYFQQYTWAKWTERILKKIKTCSPGLETSSQPPKHYSDRFYSFMDKILT